LAYKAGNDIKVVNRLDISKYFTATVTNYNTGTGVLTFTNAVATGSGTFTTWDVILAGAVGQVGAAGSTGTTGSTGDRGSTGFTGSTGRTGTTGSTGSTGSQGSTGNTGTTGSTGSTGGKGTTGSTGDRGSTGLTGSSGSTGTTGSTGLQGTTGVSGSTGSTGLTGTTGERGLGGFDGRRGLSGSTGQTGITGTTGSTGATGSRGTTGTTGPVGGSINELIFNIGGQAAGTTGFTFDKNTLILHGTSAYINYIQVNGFTGPTNSYYDKFNPKNAPAVFGRDKVVVNKNYSDSPAGHFSRYALNESGGVDFDLNRLYTPGVYVINPKNKILDAVNLISANFCNTPGTPACTQQQLAEFDGNGDGVVNGADIGIYLGDIGSSSSDTYLINYPTTINKPSGINTGSVICIENTWFEYPFTSGETGDNKPYRVIYQVAYELEDDQTKATTQGFTPSYNKFVRQGIVGKNNNTGEEYGGTGITWSAWTQDVGTPGSNGTTGATGSVGTTGFTGTTGSTGFTGSTGSTGITGTTGTTGFTGTTGTTGSTGSQGTTGISGSTGLTGTTGERGLGGFDGRRGSTGITGSTGSTGSTGFKGTTGSTGSTGNRGSTGTTGSTGSTGSQGTTGSTGSNGNRGSTGTTGSTGTSGDRGSTGSTGSTGSRGSTGLTGNTGERGPGGFDGRRGSTGSGSGSGSTYISDLGPFGATADLIGSRNSGITLVKPNAASTPVPMGPFIWWDDTNITTYDGINQGVTLTKLGQILTVRNFTADYGDSSYGITLGNGTFLCQITGYVFGFGAAMDARMVMMQGNNVRWPWTTPVTPADTTDYFGDWTLNSRTIQGWAMKISNDTSGGVTGGGNYGRYIQPF